jgi:hypothetical protein
MENSEFQGATILRACDTTYAVIFKRFVHTSFVKTALLSKTPLVLAILKWKVLVPLVRGELQQAAFEKSETIRCLLVRPVYMR